MKELFAIAFLLIWRINQIEAMKIADWNFVA
jgi:hypothetical protein